MWLPGPKLKLDAVLHWQYFGKTIRVHRLVCSMITRLVFLSSQSPAGNEARISFELLGACIQTHGGFKNEWILHTFHCKIAMTTIHHLPTTNLVGFCGCLSVHLIPTIRLGEVFRVWFLCVPCIAALLGQNFTTYETDSMYVHICGLSHSRYTCNI